MTKTKTQTQAMTNTFREHFHHLHVNDDHDVSGTTPVKAKQGVESTQAMGLVPFLSVYLCLNHSRIMSDSTFYSPEFLSLCFLDPTFVLA